METPDQQAIDNVFDALWKILNDRSLSSQHNVQLIAFCKTQLWDFQDARLMNGVNTNDMEHKKSELTKAFQYIIANIKNSMQYILMAQSTVQKAMECTFILLNKLNDENRFSIYDPDNGDSEISVPLPPQAITNMSDEADYQLAKKFDLTIGYLVDLWNSIGDFWQQLQEIRHLDIIADNDLQFYFTSLKPILEYLKSGLQNVILKSIVITKQPPLIVMTHGSIGSGKDKKSDKTKPFKEPKKCQTSFDLELKVMTSHYLARHCGVDAFTKVKPTLVTDDKVEKLLSHELKEFPKQSGKLGTTETPFKPMALRDIILWTAAFNKVKIPLAERPSGKSVEDTRYCILFTFNTVEPLLKLKTPLEDPEFVLTFNNVFVSLPFAVVVQCTKQIPHVLPGIFWCRAFAQLNYISSKFEQDPPDVPWLFFKRRLNQLFYISTGAKKLSEEQLCHLGSRMFGCESGYESKDVTFDMFCRKIIPESCDESNKGFTFFDWFYSLLNLVGNKKFKTYWNKGLMVGFISRQFATHLISSYNEPTMLIKFSDNMKGTLVFCIFLPEYRERIVYLGLDEKVIKDLTLYDCYEKLWQSHPYLNVVKRIQCSYSLGDTKSVDILVGISQEESKTSISGAEPKFGKKCPYTKAEWKLCMENPLLQNFLQKAKNEGIVPQHPAPNYVTLKSPLQFPTSPSELSRISSSIFDEEFPNMDSSSFDNELADLTLFIQSKM